MRRWWHRREKGLPYPRRRTRVIDGDPVEAIGDEIFKAADRRIRQDFQDAGILPGDDTDRPKLVLVPDPANAEANSDPLTMIGRELDAAARRLIARDKAKRQAAIRRRHYLTVAATLSLLLSSVAGASAVFSGTTGVPALDRFLDLREAQRKDARPARASELPSPGIRPRPPHSGRPSADVRPLPGSTSVRLRVPGGGLFVAYQSVGDAVCFSLPSSTGEHQSASFRLYPLWCETDNLRARRLAEEGAYVTFQRGAVVMGISRPDADVVTVREPSGGRLKVHLSRPWKLVAAHAGSIRVFLAAKTQGLLSGDLRRYVVRAR
jgi:hypothetical protein